MLCLTAFSFTFCSFIPLSGMAFEPLLSKIPSHSLSLPPSSLFLLQVRFPMPVALAGRPLTPHRLLQQTHCGQRTSPLRASSELSHVKLVSSSHLLIFKEGDSLSGSIYHMMWHSMVPISRSPKSWQPW